MFFDLHSDILYDIVQKRIDHKKDIIKDFHVPQLIKGKIMGGIWTFYTDINHPLCEFNRAIDYILEEIEHSKDIIHIITKKEDIDENKINVVLGFESLQPVKTVIDFNTLYQLGFRHAMLTWNEENHFATGVLGNPNRGLTEEGIELIDYMNKHNMIIDVSHSNKRTFNDIIKYSTKPVIASHSNVYTLCQHPRNLIDTQIHQLLDKGGLMGLTAVKSFINPDEPTINQMINHLDYLKNRNYLNQVGFGFDFMDYLNGSNLQDLPKADATEHLVEGLYKRNYSKEEIDKLSHQNALRMINELL